MARRRIKNPSPLATIFFAAAAGAGIYWWSSSAKAAGKAAKKKKLTSDKPPRYNKVELLTNFEDFKDDVPAPPWLLLLYCDNDSGRAALEQFSELGKTTSDKVQLLAMSAKAIPDAVEFCDPGTLMLDDGTQVETPGMEGFLFGQRLSGSWLEFAEGEDQPEFTLVLGADPAVNKGKVQLALAWAVGDVVMPLERAVWIGDPDLLWVPWDEQPPVVQTVIGNMYELPVKPPDPNEPVMMSNMDEVAIASDVGVYEEGVFAAPAGITPGTQFVMIAPLETTVATIISLQQGDWKRQALIRAKPGPKVTPPV